CSYITRSDIYTLSLHDALPILESFIFNSTKQHCNPLNWSNEVEPNQESFYIIRSVYLWFKKCAILVLIVLHIVEIYVHTSFSVRSEEHTSELQSRFDLVCRLLL